MCVHFAGVEAAVREHKPKVVFLTSPNNPDGSVISEVRGQGSVGMLLQLTATDSP